MRVAVEDEAGEAVALALVRVAAQDEGVDAHGPVGVERGPDLVGVADDRRTSARPSTADTGPEVALGVAVVVGALAQLGLAGHAGGGGVERLRPDGGARDVVERGDQVAGRGISLFVFNLAIPAFLFQTVATMSAAEAAP